MKQTGKRLIAVFAALALTFSVFTVGSDTAEVKAEEPQAAGTYYEELTVTNTQNNSEYTVKNLTVATNGAIVLGSIPGDADPKAATIRVTGRAVVEPEGRIRLQGRNGFGGVLVIGRGAALEVLKKDTVQVPDEEEGYILVEEEASVKLEGEFANITVGGKSVYLDGNQKLSYMLFCENGTWHGSKIDIKVPYEESKFKRLLDISPDMKFGTITIEDHTQSQIDYELNRSLRAEKLVVNTQKKLTIKESSENGVVKPTIVDVDEAELYDTVAITNFTGSSEGDANEFLVREKLTIDGASGDILAEGNGRLNLDSDGLPREIYTPALSRITSGREVRITKGSKIYNTDAQEYSEYGVDMGPFDGHNVIFDGVNNNDVDYIFIFNGGGGIIKDGGPGLSLSVTLPEEQKIFEHTRYRDKWTQRDKPSYTPETFERITVKDGNAKDFDFDLDIKELTVASGSSLTIKGRQNPENAEDHADSTVRIITEANISGILNVSGEDGKAASLSIVKDAKLNILQAGMVRTSGKGKISAEMGAIVNVGSEPLRVTFDSGEAVFDGNQKIAAELWFDGTSWTGKITSGTLETETTTDPATNPSSGTTTEPATNPSDGTTTDPETNPSSGTTTDPETNPSSGTTTDPATNPSSGTTTDPATNPATGTTSDSETESASDTTSEPASTVVSDEEPEIKDQTTSTNKAEDGTRTTTTSTTYTDGSKVTEKVVEKPDGSSTSTTTTTEADGTKIVEKVEEKADGSSKATTTTTETDGTKKTETVEKKVDGTEVTTNTVKDSEGNSTTEKVEKKTDGTVTTTNTVKDADGATTTEKAVEKPDGSVTTTSTAKDAEGNVLSTSKTVEKTKEDGTKTITATEKNADGSSSTSKTTINTDGSSKTNTTTLNVDGSTTKEKITEKADGSLTRTATTIDQDGKVLATEKEKVTVSKSGTETSTTTVEKADGSSSESVVKTKADGTTASTVTKTDSKGNVSVTVGSKKTDGSEISKSYAVEDDGVVLTAVEATTESASIPASVKVNGKSVPVTSVGDGAMKDNETVKTVKLADTITSIGEGAFSGAKNLKTIKLSANVTEIAPGAFDGIKSNATFYISATTDEEFDALVELLKKSGVGSKVKFKRAK